jgi:two-component system, NtrC family, response regulator AtoC
MPEALVETRRVLVVSRDVSLLHPLWSLADENCWNLATAESGWEAMERVHSDVSPHVMLLDVAQGDGDGLHILRWIRRLHPELPVIVTCHADDPVQPKEAIRLGAQEVIVRPFENQELESAISKSICSTNGHAPQHISSEDIETLGEDEFFLSASPVMQKLRAQAELLAQADVPVLILGEAGSGKGTIARLIHKFSIRSGFKFLRLHCGKTPAELLETELFGRKPNSSNGSGKNGQLGALSAGEKGTLLLEEITEMPLPLQARLVQELHNHQFPHNGGNHQGGVDVRILASSSVKPDRALAENRLQQDLYYRLSAFTVHVPPLRQRKEEIPVLLQYAMHKFARHYGLGPREFTPQVMDACVNHSWPGNMQELEAFVKRYLLAGDQQFVLGWLEPSARETDASETSGSLRRDEEARDSKAASRSLKSLLQSVRSETERNAIAAALEKTRWNRKAAARLLKVSYRTMLYKIDQYDINPPDHEPSSVTGFRAVSRTNGKGI